jgi:hypothetical protein
MCCSPFFKTCRRAILFQRNVVNYAIFVYLFLTTIFQRSNVISGIELRG